MTPTGTYEHPVTLADACPGCGEHGLRAEQGTLVESILAAFAGDEDFRRAFDKRLTVFCPECGWRGTAWKATR